MIDEDEVDLKKSQNTLDTSKRLHQNETRSTGSAGKLPIPNLIPNFAIIRNFKLENRQGCHSVEYHGRGWNPYPGAPPTTELLLVLSPQSKESTPFFLPE